MESALAFLSMIDPQACMANCATVSAAPTSVPAAPTFSPVTTARLWVVSGSGGDAVGWKSSRPSRGIMRWTTPSGWSYTTRPTKYEDNR